MSSYKQHSSAARKVSWQRKQVLRLVHTNSLVTSV